MMMEPLLRDIRYALRSLRRTPAFAAAAIATLAIGVGANGAVFALVDATLLRPLPYPDPSRLVMLWERTGTDDRSAVSPLNLIDWRDRGRAFSAIGGFVDGVGGMVMDGVDGRAETVSRQWVTSDFFAALGVTPIAGRTFRRSDDREHLNAVVLSEPFWRARFAADPAIVGRTIRLDGTPYTVTGVVPATAQLAGRTSVWALIWIEDAPANVRGAHFLGVVGRLKPGIDAAGGESDLASVAATLARTFPGTNKGRSVAVRPLHDAIIGSELRRTSLLFMAFVAIVLLSCCANIASLLLTRASARGAELAIRAALGAGRGRVIRQLVTESVVLSAFGGIAGAAVATGILGGAASVLPQDLLPPSVTLAFDWHVALFCAVASLAVGLLVGMAPAWTAAELSSRPLTITAPRTTTDGARRREWLIGGEVAIAVLVLFAAGLLLRTLLNVDRVERGYRARGVLTMMVDPLASQYPTPVALLQFYANVERAVAAVPDVRHVAWATTVPFGTSDGGQVTFDIAGAPVVPESQRAVADHQIVSPSYFQTIDLPLVAGRAFTDGDNAGTPRVCIVNQALARRAAPSGSPIGVRVSMRPASTPAGPAEQCEVVGVAQQVKARPDEAEDLLQIYVPLAQAPVDDVYLLVAPGNQHAQGLASSVRAAIARVDTAQLVSVRDVMTLDDVLWAATARHRFRAVLVGACAVLALLVSMVGVSGLLAYSVQRRVREIGIRRALGAATHDVLTTAVGRSARVLAIGAAVGVLASTAAGRLLASMLFGIDPWDLLTFAAVVGLVVLTAIVAAAAPARRAARIDPAIALRAD